MSADAPDSPAAWRVLAGAGVLFVFSVPALFGSTFGLFMVPLQQSQGWSRAQIAFSLTLTVAISWVSVLIGGWLADHVRLRPLLAIGVLLGAANLAAFALIGPQIWQFHLLVVALAFTSMGASPLIVSKLVQGWFDKRLGTALGLLFASAAAGGVLHPLWVTAVLQADGWRAAFAWMGAVGMIGGLTAVALALRERAAPARPAAAAPLAPAALATLREFLRSRAWWTLALWNLLFAFGSGCIGVHFAALLHDRGVAPVQIGIAASLIGASAFAGNLLAGWLVDRVDPRRMAYALMLMPLAATLLLLTGQGYALMVLAAAVLGLSGGSDGSLSAFLARHYFGPQRYGQASGTQMVATAIGGGVAPWLSGLMRDASGDYRLSLSVASGSFAAAVVVGWMLPRRGFADGA